MKNPIWLPALFLMLLSVTESWISAQPNSRQFQPGVFENAPPAHWIAPEGLPHNAFAVVNYRKSFSLDSVPAQFLVHVSGDNRYRLFVNGQSVANGPQRSDLMHWRYDTVDLAPYLKRGDNLLAAVVWNWGEHKPVAQHSYRTAFLLQGNAPFEANLVNTGTSWKVWHNQAYTPLPVSFQDVGGYFASPPGESVDGARFPWGWDRAGYDDSDWETPAVPQFWQAEITRMRGSTLTGEGAKWQLVPRSIPQMEETLIRFDRVRRTQGIDTEGAFLLGEGDLVVPANAKVSLLLDQAHLTNAYTVVQLSGGAGSQVTMTFAEALLDAEGQKGNRNEIEGKSIRGIRDVIRPDGGENRQYHSLWFRTYRYVQLDIETANQSLRIHDLHGIFTGYPFELKAKFSSNLDWLKDVWEIDWRVARLCAWETYFDTPYYEQLQYIGDTRIQGLVTLYMSDDDRLVRQAISHFDWSRMPEGITASRYPSDLPQYIPTFSLIWIAMVHDYWMHRDDEAYVRSMLPGIRGVIGWYERRMDATGLVGPIPWWPFVDWADGWNMGKPPGASDGHSIMVNLQLVYALQRAAELEDHFGLKEEGRRFRVLADVIIEKVRGKAWDKERNLFKDTLETSDFSQQTNTMAILTGASPKADQADLLQRILSDDAIVQSTYYFSYYLLEALRKAGMADDYINHLTPWQDMLALGLTTTAERPEPTRSDSHAWSAHPNYGLLATVLGVRPAEPGFKSVRIRPALGNLEFAEGEIPHPQGTIKVKLTRSSAGGIQADITLPEGLDGTFEWKDHQKELHSGRQEIRF